MSKRKTSEDGVFNVGNVVEVIETGVKGKVKSISYAGEDKTTPIYAVKISEKESKNYRGDELKFIAESNPGKKETDDDDENGGEE